MPIIMSPALTRFIASLFRAVGVPDEDAHLVAGSLVGANLRGHDSHGVLRVPQYVSLLERGDYQVGVPLLIERETAVLIGCDGQWGLGQVQAHRLLQKVLPKARTTGLGAGTIRNCGHIGRLGEYAEKAAEAGIILIATVNNGGSGQRVAPPGGIHPRLGTNPLCVAVPTESVEEPIVLDFGTSVVAEGKVRAHHVSHRPVPEGWLLDSQGQPTCDPAVLYQSPPGSILPLGGPQSYKGFGLAMILDLLSGGLSGGRCSHSDAPPPPARGNNVLFLALDPAWFAGAETLRSEASQLCRYLRTTPRAENVASIVLPGDPERAVLQERSVHGIPLEPNHWAAILDLARKLDIPPPAPEVN